jgi:DHA1 family bicyclomycin/chloramphenicol resistance-like MFS transporter
MSARLYRNALVIGLLSAIGAFAIDMYIPGFSAIGHDLHASPGTVQLSMTSYFAALAIGQIIYGPVSDAIGRRTPTFAGLALFIAASAAAAGAPSISTLIAARFVQGLGAASTAVIPMAIIRDLHTGPEAARLLSLAMASLSVSPILAPIFGGFLVQFGSWRLIFVVLIAIGLAVTLMVARLLPETLPPAQRTTLHPATILRTYRALITDRRFLGPVLIAGCAQSVLFVFISASPFLFVTLHHVPPTGFGVIFALHAICLIGTSQFNAPMLRAWGTRRTIGGGAICLAASAAAFAALVFGGATALWPLVLATLVMFTSLSLILAPAFLTAMEPFGETAGAAAALAAAAEFTVSSVATFALGLAANGTARPMAIAFLAGSVGTLVGWGLVFKAQRPGEATVTRLHGQA